jgi:hypothetical protein
MFRLPLPLRARAASIPAAPFWAKRFGTAPFLPMSRAEMDGAGLGQLRRRHRHRRRLCRPPQLRHGGDRPGAGGAGLSRRHHRPARLAQRRAVQGAGPAEPVLRRDRRQHGFDDQPLHGRSQDPQRRRLHARRRRRQAARPRQPSSTASAAARPSRTCPSSWAASKAACAASRTTTTGRTRCAAPSWSTAKCDLLLYGNAERASSRSPTAWPRASRWRKSPMCAAPPSCAARPIRGAGSRDRLHRGRPPGRIDDHINPYQTTSRGARPGRAPVVTLSK